MKSSLILFGIVFSSAAFAGGATGGFPGKTNVNLKQLFLNQVDFSKLVIQSAQGGPLNIDGKTPFLEALDLENRELLLVPEAAEDQPLIVKEQAVTEDGL